jgi:hypothetical protein
MIWAGVFLSKSVVQLTKPMLQLFSKSGSFTFPLRFFQQIKQVA